MIEFVGRIVMTPATDNWTRTVIILVEKEDKLEIQQGHLLKIF